MNGRLNTAAVVTDHHKFPTWHNNSATSYKTMLRFMSRADEVRDMIDSFKSVHIIDLNSVFKQQTVNLDCI
jgi:hypothetical protein